MLEQPAKKRKFNQSAETRHIEAEVDWLRKIAANDPVFNKLPTQELVDAMWNLPLPPTMAMAAELVFV